MRYMPIWIGQRPITATLLLILVLSMCVMAIRWRKDAEYLICSRDMCPNEHLVKYFLFHGAKVSALVLSFVSIVIKF